MEAYVRLALCIVEHYVYCMVGGANIMGTS